MVDWRQQARYEAIQEVLPAVSGDSPTENEVVSDDDEEEENTPRQLTASEALQYLDDLLHFENDEKSLG